MPNARTHKSLIDWMIIILNLLAVAGLGAYTLWEAAALLTLNAVLPRTLLAVAGGLLVAIATAYIYDDAPLKKINTLRHSNTETLFGWGGFASLLKAVTYGYATFKTFDTITHLGMPLSLSMAILIGAVVLLTQATKLVPACSQKKIPPIPPPRNWKLLPAALHTVGQIAGTMMIIVLALQYFNLDLTASFMLGALISLPVGIVTTLFYGEKFLKLEDNIQWESGPVIGGVLAALVKGGLGTVGLVNIGLGMHWDLLHGAGIAYSVFAVLVGLGMAIVQGNLIIRKMQGTATTPKLADADANAAPGGAPQTTSPSELGGEAAAAPHQIQSDCNTDPRGHQVPTK